MNYQLLRFLFSLLPDSILIIANIGNICTLAPSHSRSVDYHTLHSHSVLSLVCLVNKTNVFPVRGDAIPSWQKTQIFFFYMHLFIYFTVSLRRHLCVCSAISGVHWKYAGIKS